MDVIDYYYDYTFPYLNNELSLNYREEIGGNDGNTIKIYLNNILVKMNEHYNLRYLFDITKNYRKNKINIGQKEFKDYKFNKFIEFQPSEFFSDSDNVYYKTDSDILFDMDNFKDIIDMPYLSMNNILHCSVNNNDGIVEIIMKIHYDNPVTFRDVLLNNVIISPEYIENCFDTEYSLEIPEEKIIKKDDEKNINNELFSRTLQIKNSRKEKNTRISKTFRKTRKNKKQTKKRKHIPNEIYQQRKNKDKRLKKRKTSYTKKMPIELESKYKYKYNHKTKDTIRICEVCNTPVLSNEDLYNKTLNIDFTKSDDCVFKQIHDTILEHYIYHYGEISATFGLRDDEIPHCASCIEKKIIDKMNAYDRFMGGGYDNNYDEIENERYQDERYRWWQDDNDYDW